MGLNVGMEISFEYKNEVLKVLVTGTLELEAANRCVDQILESSIDFRAKRLLLDCRNLYGTFSIRDRFIHTDHLSEIILSALTNKQIKTLRIAYAAHPMLIDPHRFGETIARNRGIDIFVTDNWSDATEWLGGNAEQLPTTDVSCKTNFST